MTDKKALSPEIKIPNTTMPPNNKASMFSSCNCKRSGMYFVLKIKNPANKTPAKIPEIIP